jgi:hypothetical protein
VVPTKRSEGCSTLPETNRTEDSWTGGVSCKEKISQNQINKVFVSNTCSELYIFHHLCKAFIEQDKNK